MRHAASLVAIASLALLGAGKAAAQTITVSGNPAVMRINTAVAGSQPTPVTNATRTYTVTTPNPVGRTYKITAQLNANMPPGVTLTVTLAPPPNSVSVGPVNLDVTARDVVTGMPRRTNSTQTITYQVSALVTAGVMGQTTRTVTFTVLRFP
jgi:hypothetical protein